MQRRASFSSSRFQLTYNTWLASAESIDPKRDRLVEPHLSKKRKVGYPPKNNATWNFSK